ncbi:MAG TPA: FGGY-family carbohydrate kinase, partial [Niabella sp.]|nr:FGGY-family carbohydrate kinase [Niabella sp.]
DPDDEQFAKPKDMRQAIVDYCIRTHQQAPVTKGEFVRVMKESLALKYRDVVKKIEQSTGRAIEQLHIVGGGSQNEMLNQFTADATGLPVMAGPVEATAIGNIIVQAIAKKEIADMDEAAEIIGNSFSVKKYFPVDTEKWISVKPT